MQPKSIVAAAIGSLIAATGAMQAIDMTFTNVISNAVFWAFLTLGGVYASERTGILSSDQGGLSPSLCISSLLPFVFALSFLSMR